MSDFIEFTKAAAGNWSGKNLLHLSWLEVKDYWSDGAITIERSLNDRFLEIFYTWAHEGKDYQGRMLLGVDKNGAATAGWADSWHQNGGLLHLKGAFDPEQNKIAVTGHYPAPPDPDWGWRIELCAPAPDKLEMTMYNIMPSGEEDLAVKAEYQKGA
jgi:hypothetical protein